MGYVNYTPQERNGRMRLKRAFNRFGFVSEKLIDNFERISGLSAEEIAEKMESHFAMISNVAEYFDSEGTECLKTGAEYIWVSSGVESADGHPLYIGFLKSKKAERDAYDYEYYCYYISSRELLEKNFEKFKEELPVKESGEDSFFSQIYEMLLVKSIWGSLPNYQILREFFNLCESKIRNDDRFDRQEAYCKYNADRTKLAYNTGLITNYAGDIIIIADVSESGTIFNRRIAKSKTQLKQEGFSETDICPISFYKDRKDLIFTATTDDFDLDNFEKIRHIVEQRRERFPEDAAKFTDNELVNKIRASLEFDLKMTARNPYWASPFYNIKQDEIQYFLPLFTGSLDEKPSLALVIGKGEHYFELRTVLGLTTAYANAACITSPPSSWLKSE